MRNNNLLSKIAGVILCLSFAHCASTRAPSGWLTDPKNVPVDPYGGWVSVESEVGLISGELIAVANDTMFAADTSLHAVSFSSIHSVRLAVYDPGTVAAAVVGGTILTVSNGVYLFLTAPMWIIGGSVAAAIQSRDPLLDYPDVPLRDFAIYARYPQGLPTGVDRTAIRMKPPGRRITADAASANRRVEDQQNGGGNSQSDDTDKSKTAGSSSTKLTSSFDLDLSSEREVILGSRFAVTYFYKPSGQLILTFRGIVGIQTRLDVPSTMQTIEVSKDDVFYVQLDESMQYRVRVVQQVGDEISLQFLRTR